MTVRVVVHCTMTGEETVFEGAHADVCEALHRRFDWLTAGCWAVDYDLEGLVARLDACQAFEAFLNEKPAPGEPVP